MRAMGGVLLLSIAVRRHHDFLKIYRIQRFECNSATYFTLERKMKSGENQFRGHHYAGRENGLMIIAPASALRELASQTARELAEGPDIETREWPCKVGELILKGRGGGMPYAVSFHVETTSGKPSTNMPKSGSLFWTLAALSILACVGVLAIVRWVVTIAF